MIIPPLWIFKTVNFWKIYGVIAFLLVAVIYYQNNNRLPYYNTKNILYIIGGLTGITSILYTKYMYWQFNKKIINQEGVRSFTATIKSTDGSIQYLDKEKTQIDLYVYRVSFNSDLGAEHYKITGISHSDLVKYSSQEGIDQKEFLEKYFSQGSKIEIIQDQTYPNMMKIIIPYQKL